MSENFTFDSFVGRNYGYFICTAQESDCLNSARWVEMTDCEERVWIVFVAVSRLTHRPLRGTSAFLRRAVVKRTSRFIYKQIRLLLFEMREVKVGAKQFCVCSLDESFGGVWRRNKVSRRLAFRYSLKMWQNVSQKIQINFEILLYVCTYFRITSTTIQI